MRHHIAGIRLLTLAATIYHARSGLHRESTAFRGAGLIPISLNGLRVTNAFEAYLRRTNVSSANGATVLTTNGYSFDLVGRLSTARDGTFVAAYSYLANSPLVGQVVFKQNTTTRMTTTKTFDNLNRLASISTVGTGSTPSVSAHTYSYNAANQRVSVLLADGSYWVYDYDSLGQVKSGKRYWSDGSPVAGQQFEYAHDDIGNRTSTKAGGDAVGAGLRLASYTPNPLNQYSSRTVPGAVDALGAAKATAGVTVNSVAAPSRKGEYFWKEVSAANGTLPVWLNLSITANEGANNQTTSGNTFVPKTAEVFTYDLDGNVLTDGRWTYTWDGENRLTRLVPISTVGPQTRIDFEYDWQGRRIAKKVWNNVTGTGTQKISERFLYDGWNLISQLNASNNAVVRSYVWGSDLSGSMQGAGGVGGLLAVKDTANGMHFAAYDGNGNVTALVSAADASVSARYEYGPFSELLRASGTMAKLNPFRFSTKFQDDETDQLYYGYRYLSPSIGRWLSRDPIAEKGGVNLSAFARNDPIGFCDRLGLREVGTGVKICREWGIGYHQWVEYDSDGAIGFYPGTGGIWGGTGTLVDPDPHRDDADKICLNYTVDNCAVDVECFKKCVRNLKNSKPGNYCVIGSNCRGWASDSLEACRKKCLISSAKPD